MSIKEAAQRKTFKGKYKGPDRFKGNAEAIAGWKANKSKGTPSTATDVDKLKGMVNPSTPTSTSSGNLEQMPKVTSNPELDKKYGQLTKTYKGKYIGKDKYKGIAQKGKHKGKYIGIDSRKGLAKPSTSFPDNLNSLSEAVKSQAGTS